MPLEIPALSEFIDLSNMEKAIETAGNAFYDPILKRSEEEALEAFNRNVLISLGSQVEPDLFTIIRTAIENCYQVFIAMYGTRPPNEDGEGTPAQLEWEDKLDDAVAEVFAGSLRKVIGISWTEEKTVDTQAYDFMQRDELAVATTEQYLRAIVHELTINKAMAQFGYVQSAGQRDTETFQKVWAAIKGDDAKATALSFQAARRVVEEILVWHVADKGEDLDLDQLQANLAQATDRDPLIAASAITELGGEPDEHHPAFRIYATDAGPQWMADVISQAIEGKLTPMDSELEAEIVMVDGEQHEVKPAEPASEEVPDLPPALDRRKGKKGGKKKKSDQAKGVPSPETAPEPDSAASGEEVSPKQPQAVSPDPATALAALQTLRTHSGMADAEIAKELGVSRASVSSWARGKSKWEPEPEQVGVLRALLGTSKTAIDASLMSLGDG